MRAAWLAVLAALAGSMPAIAADADGGDPAEVAIGERLFLETRFAQYFYAHCDGDVNAALAAGDPTVVTTRTRDGEIPGPFAGQSMNCRACHMVDVPRPSREAGAGPMPTSPGRAPSPPATTVSRRRRGTRPRW